MPKATGRIHQAAETLLHSSSTCLLYQSELDCARGGRKKITVAFECCAAWPKVRSTKRFVRRWATPVNGDEEAFPQTATEGHFSNARTGAPPVIFRHKVSRQTRGRSRPPAWTCACTSPASARLFSAVIDCTGVAVCNRIAVVRIREGIIEVRR